MAAGIFLVALLGVVLLKGHDASNPLTILLPLFLVNFIMSFAAFSELRKTKARLERLEHELAKQRTTPK